MRTGSGGRPHIMRTPNHDRADGTLERRTAHMAALAGGWGRPAGGVTCIGRGRPIVRGVPEQAGALPPTGPIAASRNAARTASDVVETRRGPRWPSPISTRTSMRWR